MMFRTAYLHIGTEKTGSTSIQQFLASNRTGLQRLGFYYPAAFGLPNQIGLAAYAAPAGRIRDLLRSVGVHDPNGLAPYRQELGPGFRREIAALPPREHTLLLSNEHLHSRLILREEIASLRDFLSPFCEQIRVVVYLRRQDLVATSLVSTYYKVGHSKPWALPAQTPELPYYYDYATLLANYAAVFGASNCIVRLFEPARFVDGDVIDDFAAAVGLPLSPEMERPPRQNQSISDLGLAILAELNRHVPPTIQGKANPLRADLMDVIYKQHIGRPVLLTRGQARAFYQRFTAGNAELRRRYLPDLDRATLFAEDFDAYPETLPDRAFTFEQACAAAAQLWLERTGVINLQRQRVQHRIAQVEELRRDLLALSERFAAGSGEAAAGELASALYHVGEFGRAMTLTRRAIAAEPADPALRLLLGRILLGAGEAELAVVELRTALAQGADPESGTLTLAHALRRLKRLGEVRGAVEEALEKQPQSGPLRRLGAELSGREPHGRLDQGRA